MTSPRSIFAAHAPNWLPIIRALFQEYEAEIQIDLCFQGFARELAELPGKYAPPAGGLWLARCGDEIAGCVALRPLITGDASALAARDRMCEMKRLYVRPVFRGCGAGRALAQSVLDAARSSDYARLRLDTLATMTTAIALYRTLGFVEVPPYYDNPLGGATYMELVL